MQDSDETMATLRDLKALGVRLAIDDFGTGYSSLSYLRQFPIDIVKIDRSFVAGLDGGTDSRALVRSIIDLGNTLRLETVAEGIEVIEQRDQLLSLGTHTRPGLPVCSTDGCGRPPGHALGAANLEDGDPGTANGVDGPATSSPGTLESPRSTNHDPTMSQPDRSHRVQTPRQRHAGGSDRSDLPRATGRL